MKTERRRRRGERGSILLHVMVTAVLVSIFAAGIMRLALLRQQMSARGALALEEKRDDTGALSAVVSQWSTVQGQQSACSGAPPGWTGCSNAAAYPNNCNCSCSGPNGVTVTAFLNGGQCQLTITSADRTQ